MIITLDLNWPNAGGMEAISALIMAQTPYKVVKTDGSYYLKYADTRLHMYPVVINSWELPSGKAPIHGLKFGHHDSVVSNTQLTDETVKIEIDFDKFAKLREDYDTRLKESKQEKTVFKFRLELIKAFVTGLLIDEYGIVSNSSQIIFSSVAKTIEIRLSGTVFKNMYFYIGYKTYKEFNSVELEDLKINTAGIATSSSLTTPKISNGNIRIVLQYIKETITYYTDYLQKCEEFRNKSSEISTQYSKLKYELDKKASMEIDLLKEQYPILLTSPSTKFKEIWK